MFETSSNATGAWRLLHWPAMVLTGIGPMCLVFACADWSILMRTVGLVFGRTPNRLQKTHDREAVYLQRLGHSYYTEGARVFENATAKGVSDYVGKVLERLTIRMPVGDVRELLESERDRKHAHIRQAINVLGMGVRLAPSVGMLGTILGMVSLLATLEDPAHIGGHMSLALLTTFYGLFFSLGIWTPTQQKIERVLEVELDGYNQVLTWLDFIERRKPADYFADSVALPKKAQAQAA